MTRRTKNGFVVARCIVVHDRGGGGQRQERVGTSCHFVLDTAARLHQTGCIAMTTAFVTSSASGTAGALPCGLIVVLLGILPR